MNKELIIDGRKIGPGHSPYIIAELSGNHNGDIDRAFRLIDAVKSTGADAVKLQTYTADTITLDHDGPGFVIEGGLWHGRKLYDLYKEASTPWEWHPALFDYARKAGLACFSSPFDNSAIDFLESIGAPAYKIASFELIDTPLIRYAASKGKPMIMSTGMASSVEIDDAVAAAKDADGIALLHCVSGYPTPAEQSNLSRIPVLAKTYDCLIGLSDHTLGTDVSVASVALGAAIIEKHVTLARADGGPDAPFSLEPHEFKAMVDGARTAFAALGRPDREPAAAERGNMVFRRSLYVVADMAAGDTFTEANVRSIRPGLGLLPKELPRILGSQAAKPIARGTPLSLDLVRWKQSE